MKRKIYQLKLWVAIVLSLATSLSYGQASGPAGGLSGYVDQFTGDFSYSVPLLTITGPNGESFPLVASYKAGIQVNQNASSLGLGWGLSIGEITRSVHGVPDDWKGKVVKTDDPTSGDVTNEFYGPVHFDSFLPIGGLSAVGSRRMDLSFSFNHTSPGDPPFQWPAYDNYYLNAPGLSGEISPYMFDFGSFYYPPYNKDGTNVNYNTDFMGFTKKPQFRFKNESGAQILMKYYNDDFPGMRAVVTFEPNTCDGVLSSTPDGAYTEWDYMDPQYAETTLKTANDFVSPYISNCPDDDKVLWASNYIEYFTNQQIVMLYNGSGTLPGFLDCQQSHDNVQLFRTKNGMVDQDQIGAFRVTTPNGMVYHFSLPVYAFNEKSEVWEINETTLLPITKLHFSEKDSYYASSWKLTAITGPDFQDVNGNRMPDKGDKGYWISFQYGCWMSDFKWRSPYENDTYFYDGGFEPVYRDNLIRNKVVNFKSTGTFSTGHNEVYYIDKIETATHTAFFIKDFRNDQVSKPSDITSVLSPLLKLSKIILLDNEDIVSNSLFSSRQAIISPTWVLTQTNKSAVYNVEDLNNDPRIEALALRTIQFTQDYSLAKHLDNNINHINNVTSNTGKLTLLKISSYGLNHTKITPDFEFVYSPVNPDFNRWGKDYFGYYKSSYNGPTRIGYRYAEDTSFVEAWSLKSIELPSGGNISVSYQTDRYNKVSYGSNSYNLNRPSQFYRIRNADFYDDKISLEFDAESAKRVHNMHYQNSAFWYGSLFLRTTCATEECRKIRIFRKLSVDSWDNTNTVDVSFSGVGNCWSSGCNPSFVSSSESFVKFELWKAYGGGLRVNKISITEPNSGESYELHYSYGSGIITTEPFPFEADQGFDEELQLSSASSDPTALSPNVGYYVVSKTVKSITGSSEQGKELTFFHNIPPTFGRSISNVRKVRFWEYYDYPPGNSGQCFGRVLATSLRDYYYNIVADRSNYGMVDRVVKCSQQGTSVAETKYTYSFIPATQEVFSFVMDGTLGADVNGNSLPYLNKTVFNKTEYITRLVRIDNTIDGLTTTAEFSGFDPLIGVAKIITTLQPGQEDIITTNQFAYTTHPTLGSKFLDATNKNRLAETNSTRYYRSSVDNANLFDGTQSYYGQKYTRQFGTPYSSKYYTVMDDQNFDLFPNMTRVYNGRISNSDWQELSRIGARGKRNQVLEQRSADGTFSAVKYGYDDRYKIAEITNSSYTEFTYCGGEDEEDPTTLYFGSEVKLSGVKFDSVTNPAFVHTGKYSISAAENGFAMYYDFDLNLNVGFSDYYKTYDFDKEYFASVWVYEPNGLSNPEGRLSCSFVKEVGNVSVMWISVQANSSSIRIGNWFLLTLPIPANSNVPEDLSLATRITVQAWNPAGGAGSTIYFDDFRVHPLDAQMTSYNVDKKTGWVTTVLDKDNLATFFRYDTEGRVIATYRESLSGKIKVSDTQYQTARTP